MSGGHFEYAQFRLDEIADEIQHLIKNNNIPNEWGYCNNFKPETIEEFSAAVAALRVTSVAVQRIDWLICGDDSEETFHERLLEDIKKVCDQLAVDFKK